MKFSNEQYKAVISDENTAVLACPGAGKTRIIAGKVIRLLQEEESSRKIACVTYTNAALSEIDGRLSSAISSETAHRYQLSTIHSFLLGEVVVPYASQDELIPQPIKIATPDSEIFEETARNVLAQRFSDRSFKAICQARRLLDGSPAEFRDVTADEIITFWERLSELGYIDYSAILYYALKLLRFPTIAQTVSARFSWLVIDEYQDFGDVVIECLASIYRAGSSKFFIVGDYDQAIYGFNGVNLEMLAGFIREIGAEPIRLQGSRRLPQFVAKAASSLLRDGQHIDSLCDPPRVGLVAVRQCKTAISAIERVFVPSIRDRGIPNEKCAVIAPTGAILREIYKALLISGHAAVLASDRLYKRGSIAALLEAATAHAIYGSARTLEAGVRALIGVLEDAELLVRLGEAITIELVFLEIVDSFRNFVNLGTNRATRNDISELCSIISGHLAANCISRDHFVSFLNLLSRTVESFEAIDESIPLTWDNLSEQVARDHSITLATIHGSKGLEFDAVAVVGLNEDTLPFFATNDIEEERRKLYVAITRSANILLLAADRANSKPESRFLIPVMKAITEPLTSFEEGTVVC